MLRNPRKTKIVCTIGPASESAEVMDRLLAAGMDVARLNFSHGTHEEHRRKLRLLRRLSARRARPLAVLQDLCGPKLRTGEMPAEGLRVNHGEELILSGRKLRWEDRVIPVSYPRLARDVKPGDAILLADGAIELRVEKIVGEAVKCRVLGGGVIGTKKGVNIPSEALSVSGLTKKDVADLEFALTEEVDFVALSFVRSARDVLRLKRWLAGGGKAVPVIAKIEKPQALTEIDAILAAADGIMVARGDLGVEIPLEQVPGVQKTLIRKANALGKPVITATQMLRSMVDNPRPTRAEVTDVANAIWDGTDAVMLSEETASGGYPVEAVAVMDRIARTVEKEMAETGPHRPAYPEGDALAGAISYAAYQMAESLGPAAIICPTRTGATARLISRYRPDPPIIALTPSQETQRRLCLTWATIPFLTPELQAGDLLEKALAWAKKNLPLRRGDRLIITAGTSHTGATNTLRLEQV